jgi:hypothetical protein
MKNKNSNLKLPIKPKTLSHWFNASEIKKNILQIPTQVSFCLKKG